MEIALTGLALGKFAELRAGDANYPKACGKLYAMHMTEHFDALIDLPVIPKELSNDLSQMIDEARQYLNMLGQVGVKINDDIVIRIIEECLPPGTLSMCQDRLNANNLPILDDFF